MPNGRPASVDDQPGELTRQMLVDSAPVNTRRAYGRLLAELWPELSRIIG
ncbi:hypothetical protein [Frankia sp. R82]|nr:hypothetical protein [Frankia sp. R82]MCM3886655.1 hypothetical protein [Frankia sp. R82]